MGRHHPTTRRWDPPWDVRRLLRRRPIDRWGRHGPADGDDAFRDRLGSLWAAEPDESTQRWDTR